MFILQIVFYIWFNVDPYIWVIPSMVILVRVVLLSSESKKYTLLKIQTHIWKENRHTVMVPHAVTHNILTTTTTIPTRWLKRLSKNIYIIQQWFHLSLEICFASHFQTCTRLIPFPLLSCTCYIYLIWHSKIESQSV